MDPRTKRRRTPAHLAGLLKQLRSSAATERSTAIEGLCLAFENLVSALARHYYRPSLGVEREDLEQEARVGLLEACESYDEERGTFQTHAMWCVKSRLTHYIEQRGSLIPMRGTAKRYRTKLRRAKRVLTQALMREPTSIELAAAMRMKPKTIDEMLTYEEFVMSVEDITMGVRGDEDEPWIDRCCASLILSPELALIAREEATHTNGNGKPPRKE